MKPQSNAWLMTVMLAVTAFLWSSRPGIAAENEAIDPTGTWKIVRINPQTKTRSSEQILKLKLKDGKLTGTISGRSSSNGKTNLFEWALKETKLQGGDVSFTVTHAPVLGEGPDSTTVYEGRITGEIMKGKHELELYGRTFNGEWEAKRVTP